MNRPDADLAGAAEVGLCLLGSSATNAVPALTRMMRNYSATNASLASIRVLGCIGPGGLPSLSAALTNSLFPFRHVVAAAIGMNFQAHTQVIPALPLLFACATNGNEQLACASLLAIGAIGIEPGRSIPVLTNSLRDARAAVRSAGLQAFGGFKEERELLIPVAQQALGDSSLQVRASASNFVFTATNQAGVQHRAEENLKPDAL
ncbi:MAG TPA: hypothetical protein VLT36_11970 [Candidatus Dormibacteraeota bacterium]|nr:hypothetical protein [Candidatus Dormibacteraeota bacterium]